MTLEQQNISRPFFEAVKTGDVGTVLEIARNVDIACLITDATTFYENALFLASQIKDEDTAIKMVEVLTQSGVRIKTSIDSLKQTPLYYAVREGHARLIELLIEGGLNVNHLDIYGQNPIYYAISSGNVSITRLLVNKGADPDVVDLNG